MGKEGEGLIGEPKEELKDIVLTITLKPNTKYPVIEGPIKDEPLCFYLLEYARLSIIQSNNQPPKIVPAKGGIMGFARKRF